MKDCTTGFIAIFVSKSRYFEILNVGQHMGKEYLLKTSGGWREGVRWGGTRTPFLMQYQEMWSQNVNNEQQPSPPTHTFDMHIISDSCLYPWRNTLNLPC